MRGCGAFCPTAGSDTRHCHPDLTTQPRWAMFPTPSRMGPGDLRHPLAVHAGAEFGCACVGCDRFTVPDKPGLITARFAMVSNVKRAGPQRHRPAYRARDSPAPGVWHRRSDGLVPRQFFRRELFEQFSYPRLADRALAEVWRRRSCLYRGMSDRGMECSRCGEWGRWAIRD